MARFEDRQYWADGTSEERAEKYARYYDEAKIKGLWWPFIDKSEEQRGSNLDYSVLYQIVKKQNEDVDDDDFFYKREEIDIRKYIDEIRQYGEGVEMGPQWEDPNPIMFLDPGAVISKGSSNIQPQ
ncbi:MAG: hypothetical protein ACXACY_25310 [Candidatus Hodarchaeales archaeon]|jgi:hypothetical protein